LKRFVKLLSTRAYKLYAPLYALALSLEVGDGEHSAVWQADVLDADQFPSFIAQGVQVILNIIYHWPFVDLEMI
jgi:hypothetical protein